MIGIMKRAGGADAWAKKFLALFAISAMEGLVPFFRMLLLTHFLGLKELGFCAALSATFGFLEQTTDLALSRFVLTTPRAEFTTALASAHALSVLRGSFVALLGLAAAPFIAASLSLEDEWSAFALLGVASFLRGFENLAPRTAERDYQYNAQLAMNLISNGIGVSVLFAMLFWGYAHVALIASLVAQAAAYTALSHGLSREPYSGFLVHQS